MNWLGIIIHLVLLYLFLGVIVTALRPTPRSVIRDGFRRESERFNKALVVLISCFVIFVAVALWPVIWLTNLRAASLNEGVARSRGAGSTPRALVDQALETSRILIVGGYRRLAASRGCAPTSKTSDEKIMEIYQKVGTAFRQVGDQRGERIPAGVMNFIVWKFLQVYETLGNTMVDEHLAYELERYAREGLRDDYKRDLYLF
jgi:hypothetical protein